MEKEHYYNRDNYADHLIKSGSSSSLIKEFTDKEILTPVNRNTGIGGGVIKPTQTATLTKPIDANTPIILAPNVEGGLKVENPSPVNKMVITASEVFQPNDPRNQKTLTPNIPTSTTKLSDLQLSVFGKSDSKLSSIKLPDIGIMVAMVIGVIVFMYLSRKK